MVDSRDELAAISQSLRLTFKAQHPSGVQVSAQDHMGRTPLHYASTEAVAKALLQVNTEVLESQPRIQSSCMCRGRCTQRQALSVVRCTQRQALSVVRCTQRQALSVVCCTQRQALSVVRCTQRQALSVVRCTQRQALSVVRCTQRQALSVVRCTQRQAPCFGYTCRPLF